MLVTPGSDFRPSMANFGDGMPQRAMASSRMPSTAVRTDRSGIVGEDAGQHRQVAREVAHGAGKVADGLLAFGDAVEVAHGAQRLTVVPGAQAIVRARGAWIDGHGAKAYHEPCQRERDAILDALVRVALMVVTVAVTSSSRRRSRAPCPVDS